MMPKITDFVSRRLLMRKLFATFFYSNLFKNSLNIPSNKFNLGDWVINHYTVNDCSDLENGKVYTTIGYITGIVYQYPDWRIEKLKNGYSYFVKTKCFSSEMIYTDIFHESDLRFLN